MEKEVRKRRKIAGYVVLYISTVKLKVKFLSSNFLSTFHMSKFLSKKLFDLNFFVWSSQGVVIEFNICDTLTAKDRWNGILCLYFLPIHDNQYLILLLWLYSVLGFFFLIAFSLAIGPMNYRIRPAYVFFILFISLWSLTKKMIGFCFEEEKGKNIFIWSGSRLTELKV